MTASTAPAVFANQKHALTSSNISTLTGAPLNTPTPTAMPTRNLDPRLDVLGVTIEEANVAPDQLYWLTTSGRALKHSLRAGER